jgi:hypothetical protein
LYRREAPAVEKNRVEKTPQYWLTNKENPLDYSRQILYTCSPIKQSGSAGVP